jgi:hypothetical protein
MATDMRQQLGEAQAALLRALVAGGPRPEGFDPRAIKTASDALVRKRSRVVAKLWPALSGALGADFYPRFAAYAERHPLPDVGGALGDGLLFVGEALTEAELTDALRRERLRAEAHLVRRPGRLTPRRCPAVKFAWLRQQRRLAVLLTVPGRRARLLSVP